MTYTRTKLGEFSGALDVRWIKPDRFIYVPNKDDPFRFKAGDGRLIVPATMYTDGGSIPRLFWNVPGYSPWGYAPAYIVHDWLFEAHRCKVPEYSNVTFDQSATTLAEGIKTLMESGVAPQDEQTLVTIYEAVRTPLARRIWDASNACNPPAGAGFSINDQPPGELLMTIRTTPKK